MGNNEIIALNSCSVSSTHPKATAAMIDLLKLRGPKGIASFREPLVKDSVSRLKGAAVGLLRTGVENISVIQNCHDGLAMVALSLRERLPASAKVLIYKHEYPSNFFVWSRQGSKLGFRTKVIEGKELNGKPLSFSLADFETAIRSDRDIKIVAISHVQFMSGFTVPLDEIGRICRGHGKILIVDVAQSLGSTAIYPEAHGINVLVASGWKWLLGPEGIGLMYTSKEFREKFPARAFGGDNRVEESYADRNFTLDSSGKGYEPSTISRTSIVGLEVALREFALKHGGEKIEAKIRKLQRRFLAQVNRRKLKLVPLSEEERQGILSFELPRQVDPHALKAKLWDRGIIVPSPQGGYFRIAIHGINTEREADRAVEVVNKEL